MSVQDNKALARRVFDEVWSKGKVDLADEILAPDFAGYPGGGLGKPFKGPEGAKKFVRGLREAFPDIRFQVEEMVAEGDLVLTRWTARATHEGDFMGFDPTGRSATIEGFTIFRFRDGRIVEGRTLPDTYGIMSQIGALPELVRA